MWKLIRRVLVSVLALPIALAIRVLRPIIVVRIGGLRSSRIGPFASRTELYLCQSDAGIHDGRIFDIFFHSLPPSNQQLKRMWDRSLHVWQFSRIVDRVSRALPGASAHTMPTLPLRDTKGYLAKYPPHLTFTPEEESRGQSELLQIGVLPRTQFVCFLARDSAYLDATYPQGKWSYHTYRDSNIDDYLPAMQKLEECGYFVLRMGAVVSKPLPSRSSGVIDYASDHRSDFMDIYLSAKCRFFLTSGAGIDTVARIFRRPVAGVNAIPLEYISTWGPHDLTIPMKLWITEEKRFMNFREILDSGVGRFMKQEQYDHLGLEPVHNTPEEIQSLAIEMDERLNGTWITTEEDEMLQKRFWSLFQTSELNGVFLSRIGTEFLKQNQDLLD